MSTINKATMATIMEYLCEDKVDYPLDNYDRGMILEYLCEHDSDHCCYNKATGYMLLNNDKSLAVCFKSNGSVETSNVDNIDKFLREKVLEVFARLYE